jgi:hypothetical protein
MGLGLKAAAEAGESASGSDDAVAWRHDRYRIPAVGRPDGARGGGMSDLSCDLPIGSRLPERNRQQRVPDSALKSCSVEVELQREHLSPARKILFELMLGFDEHGMVGLLLAESHAHTSGPVVLEEDCGKTLVAPYQCESADRGLHCLVNVTRSPCGIKLCHCTLGGVGTVQVSRERRRPSIGDVNLKGSAPPNGLLAVFGHMHQTAAMSENG